MKPSPFNIYLGARFSRKSELVGYKRDIESLGAMFGLPLFVRSSWLVLPDRRDDPDFSVPLNERDRSFATKCSQIARRDIEDLNNCDLLISFSEIPYDEYSTGGRHVEFGYMLARQKPIILVGQIENVFHAQAMTISTNWVGARNIALELAQSKQNWGSDE